MPLPSLVLLTFSPLLQQIDCTCIDVSGIFFTSLSEKHKSSACYSVNWTGARQILLDMPCPVQVLVDLASHVMLVGVATFHARCPFVPHDSDQTHTCNLSFTCTTVLHLRNAAFHDMLSSVHPCTTHESIRIGHASYCFVVV